MFLRAFIFLIASAAAGGAAWLTAQTGAQNAPAQVQVQTAEIPTVDVLVAAANIPGGDVLSPEAVRWEPWPEAHVSDRFITRPDRPEAIEELAGTFLNSGFAVGEPISKSRLMAVNENMLSNKIEPGMLAAAVKVSAESAAGGFILPGDRVDVIHTMNTAGGEGQPARNNSRIIISNVRVLAIDQTAAQTPEGTVLGKTATLELSPPDAARIMSADASGLLSLALRSMSDHTAEPVVIGEETPASTVVVRRRGESSVVTVR